MSADNQFGMYQRGMTTLLITSLLLVLMLMISLYSAREMVSGHRVSRNYNQVIEVELQRDAMLSHALAQLRRLGPTIGSFQSRFLDTHYNVETMPYELSNANSKILTQQINIYYEGLVRSQLVDWMPVFKNIPATGMIKSSDYGSSALFEFYFGIEAENKHQLKALATQTVTDCANIRSPAVGLVWVTGSCELGFTKNDFGQPIVLYVEQGGVKLDAGSIFNGIVLVDNLTESSAFNPNLDIQGEVNGAILMFGEFDTEVELNRVKFNASLVRKLTQSHHLQYLTQRVGGWRDF
jgi:hypothetical protein